ncbi:hypothetical protein PGTUg99_031351 [Puccinia graminis f. sp. tritici]|uniref:Zinc finger PHD-type domain-containing protein n=1 Tax=Puccinia graminis f. sp. tritici TaxID=56615 RepID=A0A5B0SKA2_PUCGR|nr:hypothetical protein PGTUg99_031351 [Puccinia graminis f. sp. tritici]
MFSISILVAAAMLLQVITASAIIHPSDTIASVGKNTLVKSGHKHTKRMESLREQLSGRCGKCGHGLDGGIYECSGCRVKFHSGCMWSGQQCSICIIKERIGQREVQKTQDENQRREESSSRYYLDEARNKYRNSDYRDKNY